MKKFIVGLCIVASTCVSHAALLIDDFEAGTHTIGDSVIGVNGWTDLNDTPTQGAWVIATNSALRLGSGAMQYRDDDASATQGAVHIRNTFGAISADLVVTFDWMAPASTAASLNLFNGAAQSVFLSMSGTSLKVKESGGWKTLTTDLVYGEWYRFELTTHLDTHTFDLVVTNESGAYYSETGLGFLNTSVTELDRIDFYNNKSPGSGTGDTFYIDNVSVTIVPEPPQSPEFIDTFENGVPADSDDTTNFWTSVLTETSTVSENGTLVQTASADTAGTISSTSASPLSSKFNFFTQPIKFSADLTVDGNTSKTFMNEGMFVLASAASTGRAAADTLMVGFKQSNRLTFARKLNAPGVLPFQTHAAVTKILDTSLPVPGKQLDRFELTLDADRYLLKVFNGGGGSGISRVSGLHGIPEEDWGSGSSALLLETVRSSAAAAGTVSTSLWDNVNVEADTTHMLSEPHLDFQATYLSSYPTGTSGTRDYKIWIPSSEPVIRGVIFFDAGSGADFRYMVHDFAAQEAARSIGFALIGCKSEGNMNLWSDNPDYIKPAVQAVLDAAAAVSGRPEISNAPLCMTGNSAGSFDSAFLAKNWPERVISFVCHRGLDSNMVLSDEAKKVPGLMVAGSVDSNGATEPFIMQSQFLGWRSQGAQVAFATDWRVGHTMRGNQSFEGTFTWFVEVVNLRYPRPLLPSRESGAGWPALITLTDDSGWLGDRTEYSGVRTPSVTSPFTVIEPYASYGSSHANASWLPNETCARMYRTLTSTDLAVRGVVPLQTPLRITSPAQFASAFTNGQSVSIELDPREFDDVNALTDVKFYDGETLLGTDTVGPDWSYTFTPVGEGLHTLSLVATDALGNQGSAFRTLHVVPADFLPVAFYQSHTFSGNNNLTGTLTGADPEGNPITFALVDAPLHGQLLNFDTSTGSFTYQPDGGYVGTDLFTFAAVSGGVTGSAAVVSFDVTPSAAGGFFSFSATTMKVDKTAGMATLTVNRTGETAGAVSVDYATSDSSATASTHYAATTGTLSWADGDSAPKMFTVPLINTAGPQLPRQFKVILSNPVGGVLLVAGSAVLIEDPAATLDAPWSQTVLGTLTDSSPAVSAEGTLGDAVIGGSGLFANETSDHGHFMYQSHTGDGVLTMFVPEPVPAQAAARFAVMVRSSLSSNSVMVAAVSSGDAASYGTKQVSRATTSGAIVSAPATSNNQSTPYWLRVIRNGLLFTTQSSADGITWTQLGTRNISMPDTVRWGIFHSSADLDSSTGEGDYQLATFENLSLGALPLPGTPEDLRLEVFASSPYLYWNAPDFAAGYRVERRIWTNSFVLVSASQTAVFYKDDNIADDTGYEYRVQAYNSTGNGLWSAGMRTIYSPGDFMATDADGDGHNNGQEYWVRTDPQDSNDVLRVQAVVDGSSPTPFTLQWSAKGGVRYRVQYTDDLSSGWTGVERSVEVETQPGADGEPGTGSFTDDWTLTPPPAANQRFYRILVLYSSVDL